VGTRVMNRRTGDDWLGLEGRMDRPDVSGGEALAAARRPGNAGSNTAAAAPPGAASYRQRSWDELEGRFLGLMAYLEGYSGVRVGM
jgi:hypothetical protein